MTPASNNAHPQRVLLGLECGGTRTVAIAASEDFTLLQRIEAGPCNLRLVSDDELQQRFSEIATQTPGVVAVGVGMAGVRDAQARDDGRAQRGGRVIEGQ